MAEQGNAADQEEQPKTREEIAADFMKLLNEERPTVEHLQLGPALAENLIDNDAEFAEFKGPLRKFIYKARDILRAPQSRMIKSDWAYLAAILNINLDQLCPAIPGPNKTAEKKAESATPAHGKFLATLRRAKATSHTFHSIVPELTNSLREEMPPALAEKFAQGEWTKVTDVTGPTSILDDVMKVDQESEASRKLDAAWSTLAAAMQHLAPEDVVEDADKALTAVKAKLIAPLREAGVPQGEVASLLAISILPQIRHHLMARADALGDGEQERQLAAVMDSVGMSSADIVEASPWTTLLEALKLDELAENRLERHKARKRRGDITTPNPQASDVFDTFHALIGTCSVPAGWKDTLSRGGNCPLHTLAPGLCPAGAHCTAKHPRGDDATHAWNGLRKVFPELLLNTARSNIIRAASALTATGAYVDDALPARAPRYGGSGGGGGGKGGNKRKGKGGGAQSAPEKDAKPAAAAASASAPPASTKPSPSK